MGGGDNACWWWERGTCRVRGCLRPFTGGQLGLVVRVYDRATWHDGGDVDAIEGLNLGSRVYLTNCVGIAAAVYRVTAVRSAGDSPSLPIVNASMALRVWHVQRMCLDAEM